MRNPADSSYGSINNNDVTSRCLFTIPALTSQLIALRAEVLLRRGTGNQERSKRATNVAPTVHCGCGGWGLPGAGTDVYFPLSGMAGTEVCFPLNAPPKLLEPRGNDASNIEPMVHESIAGLVRPTFHHERVVQQVEEHR